MNFGMAEKIANAVLYEGYMLYPYRPSAVKNRQRWNFGTLYAASYEEVRLGTERSTMHVECLRDGDAVGSIGVQVRFLQLGTCNDGQAWDNVIERTVECEMQVASPCGHAFRFDGVKGKISGSVRLHLEDVQGVKKLCIDLVNDSQAVASASRDEALLHSMLSAHMILKLQGGAFVSLLDPPEALKDAVANCRNDGCFPVLVGEPGQRDMMLCSPIILYDYPQIAPESAGDFFDGTEMDEMLTLRVMTMTADEKTEMCSADERARRLLERTEQTAREQLMRTHGTIRSLRPVTDHE